MASRYSVEAIFKAIDRFSAPVARMQRRSARFARGLRSGLAGMQRATGAIVGSFSRIIRYASLAGTAMAGLAARDVVKTGMDFEAAMSGVGAVMLKNRDQMGALTAEAKRLGATTKFTASEAAAGMEIMSKAGYKEKDTLTGISGVLNAAAASGMELAETADHVSNVLKGMGLATSDAGKVADVLALASSRTNSTIGSLGESMKNVSAVAKHLRIPMEDVVAAVASLQDVGLDASVAGSATATMLTKLAKPTDALRAKMKAMGVSFEDTHGNMRPFPTVLAQLAKAAEKSGGNMEQIAFFSDLVGMRGQKAALALQDLAKKGKLEPLVEQLRKAAGTSEKMAKIRLDNLAGDVTLFKSALDGLEVKLFDVQDGALRGIVRRAREWITANEDIIAQDFAYWIDQLRPLKEIFSNAFMETLKGIGDAFDFWTGPLRSTEEIAASPTWRGFAQTLGKVSAILLVGVPLVWALNLVARIASIGVWLFEAALNASAVATAWLRKEAVLTTLAEWRATVAVWASKVAHWARNVAVAIGELGTRKLTLATLADTLKTGLNTVAQWAKVTAQAAVNLAVKIGRGILRLYIGMTSGATLKDIAATIALWAKAVAQGAVNLAVRGYNKIAGTCIKLIAGTGEAAAGAATGMGAFALTMGAVAAAVTAVYLAVKQLMALLDEAEGKGGLIGVMSLLMPLSAPVSAAILEKHQNKLARTRAAKRPAVVKEIPHGVKVSGVDAEDAAFGIRYDEEGNPLTRAPRAVSDINSVMSKLTKTLEGLSPGGAGSPTDMGASMADLTKALQAITPGESGMMGMSVQELTAMNAQLVQQTLEKQELEITVRSEQGTEAGVSKRPKRGNTRVRLQPSGAM